MASRDLKNNIDVQVGLDLDTYSASVSGEIIDTAGYESVTVVVCGSGTTITSGTHYFTTTIEAGDDSALSDAVVASGDDVLGSAVWTADGNQTYYLGYVGDKRYIRPVLNETGTAEIVANCVVILGHPHKAPVA